MIQEFLHKLFRRPMSRIQMSIWIEKKSSILLETLACLYLYTGDEFTDNWRNSVWHIFNYVHTLKDGKLPDPDLIYSNIYLINQSRMYKIIDGARNRNHSVSPKRYDTSSFVILCENYFTWLSEQLSKYGSVSQSSVYRKLKQIGL